MAKKRGPDGVPIDVPSHMPNIERAGRGAAKGADQAAGGDEPTDPPKKNRPGALFPEEEEKTAPVGTPPPGRWRKDAAADVTQPGPLPKREEEKTRIHGGQRRRTAADTSAEAAAKPADAVSDPVAGWLVVVEGPGLGQVLTVGHGQNSIGRQPTQRIAIDFGDEEISRENHAVITYDPRGRKFFVQQGSGTNLIYLDDEPVLTPSPIETHAEIVIGQTRLRFVAFCGPDFSWQDR